MLRDVKVPKMVDEQMEAKDLFSGVPPLEALRSFVSLLILCGKHVRRDIFETGNLGHQQG